MGLGRVGFEGQKRCDMVPKEVVNGFDGAIADAQPDEFRRAAIKEAAELEIGILGDDDEPFWRA